MNKLSTQTIKDFVKSSNAQIFTWCSFVVITWRACLELINQTIAPLVVHYGQNIAEIYARNNLNFPGAVPTASFDNGLNRWLLWDGGWYMRIIDHGYIIIHGLKGEETIAFFPVFPKVVAMISNLFGLKPAYVGLALNVILLIFASYFLFQLTFIIGERLGYKKEELQTTARVAVFILLLNPASFFFAAFYTEAILALCFIAACYYSLKHNYLAAAIFAGVASGTKITGNILLPIIIMIYLTERYQAKTLFTNIFAQVKQLALVAAVSVSGLAIFMAYQLMRFGDPLVFYRVEKYWGRNTPGIINSINAIWDKYYHPVVNHDFSFLTNTGIFNLYLVLVPILVTVFSVYLLVRYREKFLWLAALCMSGVVLTILSGMLDSVNRYVLIASPAFSYLAIVTTKSKKPAVKYVLWSSLAVSASLMLVFMISFLSSYFMG